MLDDLGFVRGVEGTSEAPTENATGSRFVASETGFNCKNLMDSSVCWLHLLLIMLLLLLFFWVFLVLRDILGYRKVLLCKEFIGRRFVDLTLNGPVTRETIFNSAPNQLLIYIYW